VDSADLSVEGAETLWESAGRWLPVAGTGQTPGGRKDRSVGRHVVCRGMVDLGAGKKTLKSMSSRDWFSFGGRSSGRECSTNTALLPGLDALES